MKTKKIVLSGIMAVLSTFNSASAEPVVAKPNYRLSVDSGWFNTSDSNLDFGMTYSGWDLAEQKRNHHRGIAPAAIDMINRAQKQIVVSTFLFDNMYGTTKPEYDVVNVMTNLLLEKKKQNPSIKIVVILDSLNRAYARRVSPSVQKFIDNGIDVYYSDVLSTKASTRDRIIEAIAEINRRIDNLTHGLSGSLISNAAHLAKIPGKKLDNEPVTLETGLGAALIKANHRKILVTDVDGTDEMKALVSSANPHNASDDSTNVHISVKGDLAKVIYGVLREDALHSLQLQSIRDLNVGPEKFALLSQESRNKYGLPENSKEKISAYINDTLPAVDFNSLNRNDQNTQNNAEAVKAKFVSEGQIKKEVLRLIQNIQSDDDVRIQMFYLSEPEVVQAILKASLDSKRTQPIKLLLDPNKDAFNTIKDGSPNRQVAHYLLKSGGKLEVRWYATHGEQNHAKIMSITNQRTGKKEIIAGSCNWTRKNMDDINMETNLSVIGSSKLVGKFNSLFDKLWTNNDEKEFYTYDYQAYDLNSTRAMNEGHQIVKKWSDEEKTTWLNNNKERLLEIFKAEITSLRPRLNSMDYQAYAENAFEKDKTSLARAMNLLVGQDFLQNEMSDQKSTETSEDKYKKWEKAYLKKWTKGEASGYVAW